MPASSILRRSDCLDSGCLRPSECTHGWPWTVQCPDPASPRAGGKALTTRTTGPRHAARRCVIGSFPALPPSFRLPKAKVPKREITVSPLTPARAPNPLWVCPPRSTTQGDFSPALFSVFQLRYRRVHKWLFGYLVKW